MRADERRDVGAPEAVLHEHAHEARIERVGRVGCSEEAARAPGRQQRDAILHRDVHAPGFGLAHLDVEQSPELAQRALALVAQIVRRLTQLEPRDFVVERGDLLQKIVHARQRPLDLSIHVRHLLPELTIEPVQRRDERLGGGAHRCAFERGTRRDRAREIRPGVVEVIERRAEPDRPVAADDLLDQRERLGLRAARAELAAVTQQLLLDEGILRAVHRDLPNARAEGAGRRELWELGRDHLALARVVRVADVGDVVAGRAHAELGHGEPALGDVQRSVQTAHRCAP
jgi:hypothetical protein